MKTSSRLVAAVGLLSVWPLVATAQEPPKVNVKFANSVVRVPFRILTEEEGKLLDKNYKDIKKQVDEDFKRKS
jgi:hypothetical protein